MTPIARGTESHPISRFMSRTLVSATPRTTVGEATAQSTRLGTQHVLVFDGDVLLGVLCRCALDRARPATECGSLIRRPAVTADATLSRPAAAALMAKEAVGCLPLLAGGLVLGVVTRTDMLRAGVPREDLGGPCAVCGSQHDLPADAAEGNVVFCRECLECPPTDEIGGGD